MQKNINRMITIIVDRARIIIHLRSFKIVILIDTRIRKRFNVRIWLCFEALM
jgi:hypothetical protein